MGWIKELDDLSPRVKSFIICIACLMPFWYVSIYIFNADLFERDNHYLILSFAFCFSLLWYFVSLFLNLIVVEIASKLLKLNSHDVEEEEPVLLGGADSIIYLCIAILICYVSKHKYETAHFEYHFMQFLSWAFWFAIIRVVIISSSAIFITIANNRQQQPPSQPTIDTLNT